MIERGKTGIDFQPFNPVELAQDTERIVCEGSNKKYNGFADLVDSENYHVLSAWTSGCCLRCIFCWAPLSRDFPEKYGQFCAPQDVLINLYKLATEVGVNPAKIPVTLSGCEPTIGKEHLIELADVIERHSVFPSLSIETNGILLGNNIKYVYELAKFSKINYRISLKAGTPEGFEKRTGAQGRFYDLQFKAIENILKIYAPLNPITLYAMTDSRIMPKEERETLIKKLDKIDHRLPKILHEETLLPYKRSLMRLKKVGLNINFTSAERKEGSIL